MQLRRWQTEALAAWEPRRRGVVSVVTGAGKTLFALATVKRLWNEEPDCRVMIVVPTVALQDQWLLDCKDYLGVDAVALRGGGKTSARVVILVINTARTAARELAREGKWFQIVDECHRIGTPENQKALLRNARATLGLSATPRRQFDDNFEAYIEPAIGPEIFTYSYADAARDGILAKFELHNYRINLNEAEQLELDRLNRNIARLSNRNVALDDPRLKAVLLRRARHLQGLKARVPTAVALVDAHEGARAIVFHESTTAANEIHALLVNAGHRAVIYHTGLGPTRRRHDLQLFRLGAADVLVCCRALDEGLNVPRTELAVIASSTQSQRQRVQRLGRVLRPHLRKERAIVCTIYATDRERTQLEDESQRLIGLSDVRWFSSRIS